MRRFIVSFYLILCLSIFMIPTSADNHYFYRETIEGYYRFDGQTYRWDSEREFVIDDYVFWINGTDTENPQKMVNVTLLDDSQYGELTTLTQPVNEANFVMDAELLVNGSIIVINWDILLFRDADTAGGDPFNNEQRSILTREENQRYDLENSPDYFTYNLQYFEFHNETGNIVKYKVNAELSANNYDDGRTFYTALHIIKRDSENNIIFDYNRVILEVNEVEQLVNWLDQPYLLVPYQIGAVLLAIYIYIRIVRYWRENGYRIVKDEPELKTEGETETAEEDQSER